MTLKEETTFESVIWMPRKGTKVLLTHFGTLNGKGQGLLIISRSRRRQAISTPTPSCGIMPPPPPPLALLPFQCPPSFLPMSSAAGTAFLFWDDAEVTSAKCWDIYTPSPWNSLLTQPFSDIRIPPSDVDIILVSPPSFLVVRAAGRRRPRGREDVFVPFFFPLILFQIREIAVLRHNFEQRNWVEKQLREGRRNSSNTSAQTDRQTEKGLASGHRKGKGMKVAKAPAAACASLP